MSKSITPKPSGTVGRPKNSKTAADVIRMARRQTRAAINTLRDIMKDTDQNSFARIQAAQALLVRAWGQPKGRIETIHHMSDLDLERAARAILEKRRQIPTQVVEAEPEFVEIIDEEPSK
jgi:hypothetical protein